MLKHLNKYLHVYVSSVIAVFFACLVAGLAFREAGLTLRLEKGEAVRTFPQSHDQASVKPAGDGTVKEPAETESVAVSSPLPSVSNRPALVRRLVSHHDQHPTEAGSCSDAATPTGMQRPYVAGPVAASVGDLCVFRLSDEKVRADWIIVPDATCYVDSSGCSLAFASNRPATYTVVAAVVEDGLPKILQHVCEYGKSPEPSPNPDPTPTPRPAPEPTTLAGWIRQNIPDSGRPQCAALASCYESTAEALENGSIKTSAAAYAALRSTTQTKIKSEIWSGFLDTLSQKMSERLDGKTDANSLAVLLKEIAAALRTVSGMEASAEPEVSAPTLLPLPQTVCPDPTGKPCPPQPTRTERRAP